MHTDQIHSIAHMEFGELPQNIIRKTIGMCNEVYELTFDSHACILRMNQEKEFLYGTHKFLPLFQELEIKTPRMIAEDYSKKHVPFCYQIQTKLEGKDLGVVINELNPSQLTGIAREISDIFDKFKTLPRPQSFGGLTGLTEHSTDTLLEEKMNQRNTVLERNKHSKVLDTETLEIYDELLRDFSPYLSQVKPMLYFDDMNSKNVMIHQGQFNGLVDLDFMMKGDYLEVMGTMMSNWYGEEAGECYTREVMRFQQLDAYQQNIVKLYGILNLVLWTSEAGIRFNSNSTGQINWDNIRKKKQQILGLYHSIKG